MASAGQAQAHSSQPTHFSRPSGCRFSTCRPWYRALVCFGTSGYSSVVTFLNMVAKVTPKPRAGPGSQLARFPGAVGGAPVCRATAPPSRRAGVFSDIAVLLGGCGAAPSGADDRAGADRLAAAQPRGRGDAQVHRGHRE